MIISELITELQKHDPNLKVVIQYIDPTDWLYQTELIVDDIEEDTFLSERDNDEGDEEVLIINFVESRQ